MRVTKILIGIAVAVAPIAYLLSRDEGPREMARGANGSEEGAKTAIDSRHRNELADALIRRQAAQAAPGSDDRVEQLEERLEALEATRDEDQERAAEDKKRAGRITGKGLSRWMDEKLRGGERDQATTDRTRGHVREMLALLPGVSLGELECGKRFCRASFAQSDGKAPSTADIFGTSPHVKQGFAVTDEDGKVTFYFTTPEGKLDALRKEAIAAAP